MIIWEYMKIIADLHIHSKYARAVSPKMQIPDIYFWSARKGINLISTGDFTHPQYLKHLKENLQENDSGFLQYKNSKPGDRKVKFVLGTEIACIYKDKEKVRRLHLCVLVPDFVSVGKIISALEKRKCNLKSDGRPIIGMSAKELTDICLQANEKALIIPAHIWTPWFGLLGSKSGYDSLTDCFEEYSKNIYAVETGLSSDPPMNWRLSALDDLTLVSSSDAHSPRNIGREANVFKMQKFTYGEMYDILKNKDQEKFLYTVEFYPQEGRYHYDGHRKCDFVCSPQDSKNKHKNICPLCKRELTLGVEHRVDDLADRELGFKPKKAIDFKSLVPLQEIISECLQKGKNTKSVQTVYEKMIKNNSEFEVLLDLDKQEIKSMANKVIAEAVERVRQGRIHIEPGYDGDYGTVRIFNEKEINELLPQQEKLF